MKTRISVSIYSALAMCGILFTQSCTKDEVKNETAGVKSGLQEIMVSMPQEGAESRISLNDDGTKITATWNEKDIIYLVPKSATSAEAENIYEYVCNEGNTNTALFTLSESENGIGLPEGEFYAFYGVKEIGYDNGITYTLESPKNMYSKGNKDIIALENSHAMKAESEYRGNTLSSIAFESLMSIIEVKADISEYTRPQVMTMVTENPEGFITRQTFMASTGNAVGEPTRSGELKIDYYDAKSATPTYGYFMIIPQDLASQTIQIALNGIYKSEILTGMNFREGVAYTKELSLNNAFGSEGSEQDPWIINTPEELLALSNMSIYEIKGKHINLDSDIDMSGIENFRPIGANIFNDYLEIYFDGKEHTISNLNINNLNTDNTGLFDNLYVGSIKNLTLQSININSNSRYVGLLVGQTVKGGEISNIKIQNGHINVDFNANNPFNDESNIGGIAGMADCIIKDITIDGNSKFTLIPGEFHGQMGGIIGIGNNATLEGNITNNATLEGLSVGGIVGYIQSECSSSTSTVLTNKGNITAQEYAGGIIAMWGSDQGKFNATMHNYGNITVNQTNNYSNIRAGGLIGFSDINLNNINMNGTSSGNITVNATGNNTVYAGWKVGYSYMPSTIDANTGYTGSPTISATSNGGECYINGHLQNGATSDGYDKEEWN